MSIMCSAVNRSNVVLFELGINKRGDPVYRISWYNGEKWAHARYKHFEPAEATYKLLSRMI